MGKNSSAPLADMVSRVSSGSLRGLFSVYSKDTELILVTEIIMHENPEIVIPAPGFIPHLDDLLPLKIVKGTMP